MQAGEWGRADAKAKTSYCTAVLRKLPRAIRKLTTFVGIDHFRLGAHQNDVGVFDVDGRLFVLVPGGDVVLGFDGQSFSPTKPIAKSFAWSQTQHGLPQSLSEYVDTLTTPLRKVNVPTLLVEQETELAYWKPIRVRRAHRLLHEAGVGWTLTDQGVSFHGRHAVRIDATDSGPRAFEGGDVFPSELRRRVRPFRLPTPDEWEHLCGGGARALWRWGQRAPCDHFPEGEYRFDAHRRLNAYGLRLRTKYGSTELMKGGVFRGGDRGHMRANCAGYFRCWLTQASSYDDPDSMRLAPDEKLDRFTGCRRVLQIDD